MKPIEIIQGTDIIICDNTECDFTIKSTLDQAENLDFSPYLNMPCPKCGENLLTEQDFRLATASLSLINAFNKKIDKGSIELDTEDSRVYAKVKFYNGIKIDIMNDNEYCKCGNEITESQDIAQGVCRECR